MFHKVLIKVFQDLEIIEDKEVNSLLADSEDWYDNFGKDKEDKPAPKWSKTLKEKVFQNWIFKLLVAFFIGVLLKRKLQNIMNPPIIEEEDPIANFEKDGGLKR